MVPKQIAKKTLKTVIKKIVIKQAPKFAARCATKKIPLVGLVAGAVFAVG